MLLHFKQVKGFKKIQNIKDYYEKGKQLGKGAYGTVLQAKHRASGNVVAVKVIKKKKLEGNLVGLMQNELMLLENIDHPHITRVFELMEDDLNYYVVMEYLVGGNLFECVKENLNQGR